MRSRVGAKHIAKFYTSDAGCCYWGLHVSMRKRLSMRMKQVIIIFNSSWRQERARGKSANRNPESKMPTTTTSTFKQPCHVDILHQSFRQQLTIKNLGQAQAAGQLPHDLCNFSTCHLHRPVLGIGATNLLRCVNSCLTKMSRNAMFRCRLVTMGHAGDSASAAEGSPDSQIRCARID